MSPETPAQATPLVSVICRSMGRPALAHTLQSVNAQTYPSIEVVLVDASGKGLGDNSIYCHDLTLVNVADGKPHSRSQAANAGLDAAHGQWLMLLDDDDWIDPAHIQNLVSCLQQAHNCKAAYSSTQKTDSSGTSCGFTFNTPYDPVLLMRDNYIPIHAMLFHRSLLQQQCRFDEKFDIYEDWDFWLQLNQHTDFVHVDEITAYYREGGDSETAVTNTSSRYQPDTLLGQARAAIFDKWLPRWTGNQINRLIGNLDKSQELKELAAQLHSARVQLDEATHRQHILQGKLDQVEPLLANKDSHIHDLQQHIIQADNTLNNIYSSMSWKLMGPFRRAYRAMAKVNPADSTAKKQR